MRISLFTGIRRGEVLNIERADVSLGEGYYRAINNKSKDKHKVYREIPLPVYDDFRYFMERNSHTPYPFNVYKPNSYTCMTKKLLKRYNFHSDLHLHSFRHTAATRAIESGMDIREVQKILDHSRMSVTELYAHDKVKKALDIGLE